MSEDTAARPAIGPGAALRAFRQAPRPHDPVRDDRGSADLCAVGGQFPRHLAQGPAADRLYRGARARRRAERHGARQPRQADPRQHRRPRRRHEDGRAPPHAGHRRHAAGGRRHLRHAQRHFGRCHRRCVQDHAQRPPLCDAGGRPGADGRRIYRTDHGRAAAAPRHAALFGRHSAAVAGDFRHHRGAGLSGAALHVRAPDAAHHRQHDGVPRRSGKSRPHHRAVGARRRDRRRRARARHHAERAGLDAAPEEPARRARARGVEDQSRSAQPARLGAAVFRPAGERCPIPPCSASRRS